jgi:hypothetical protein
VLIKTRGRRVVENFATADFIQEFATVLLASFIVIIFVRNFPNRAGTKLTINVFVESFATTAKPTRVRHIDRF